MIRITDATPAGAVIRVATLNFEMDGPADALLAAYERGVHVRIVMPDEARESAQVDRLVATSAVTSRRWLPREVHLRLSVAEHVLDDAHQDVPV